MSKKYEYSIIIFEQKNGWYERENITLDHPITEADLSAMENADSPETDALNDYHVVTNWKLLKVTGTFTYQFVCQVTEKSSKKTHLKSIIKVLDHQITVTTIIQDYSLLETEFITSGWKSLIFTDFTILSFQEIPDE